MKARLDSYAFSMQPADEVLWEAIQAGDSNAFKALYEKYVDLLFNYGRKMSSEKSLVQDSMQDTFRVIWEKRATIVIKRSIKQYIFTIFRRDLVAKIQHQQLMTSLVYEPDFDISIEYKIILDEGQQQLRKNLDQAISTLTNRQKEILFLRYYENLTYDEIAELMDLNQNSMYKLLSAAISRLKKYFAGLTIGLIIPLVADPLPF